LAAGLVVFFGPEKRPPLLFSNVTSFSSVVLAWNGSLFLLDAHDRFSPPLSKPRAMSFRPLIVFSNLLFPSLDAALSVRAGLLRRLPCFARLRGGTRLVLSPFDSHGARPTTPTTISRPFEPSS